MKRAIVIWGILITASIAVLFAQASGTPNQLRVITDANGYLTTTVVAQTLPLSQPTLFSNTRLRTDASGYLLVAASGLPVGYPALSGNSFDLLRGDGVFSTTIPYGTVTTSSPWTWTQTWNAAATFNTFVVTVTNTSANEGSAYFSVNNGSGNIFRVEKETTNSGGTQHAGIVLNAWDTAGSQDTYISTYSGGIYFTNNNRASLKKLDVSGWNVHQLASDSSPKISALYTTGIQLVSGLSTCWSSSATTTNTACDTGLNRDAAGVLAVTTGTASTYRDLRSRHLLGAGTAPAVTNTSANSCGTTAASLVGSDTAGKVTVGATSGTSCTITFTSAFANAPGCSTTNETTANLVRATSTASTVILAGVFVAGDVLAYNCISY